MNHPSTNTKTRSQSMLLVLLLSTTVASCGGANDSTSDPVAGAPAPAPAPATYVTVANEGQSFIVSGTQVVRYGAGTTWITKSISGTVSCSNSFFGNDPAPGIVKVCQASGATAPAPAPAPAPTGTGLTSSMLLISKKVPSYASSVVYQNSPGNASDTDPKTQWTPGQLPAWIAYDLSAVPEAQRQNNLVVWNDERPGYIVTPLTAFAEVPIAYTIETNVAAGGSQPPTTGWHTAVSVQGNNRGTMQHLVNLAGANWVRMNVTQASDPAGGLVLDLDVYATPSGATDSWLFMGDSITFLGLTYYDSDLPALVQKQKPGRFPAVIVGAISGTSAQSAVNVIDDTMRGFPGQFVVLAYGTNDGSDEFPANMELLIQKVIASGRVPVVPHMPWSDQRIDRGPVINAAIDLLYQKYPQILRGPDLWTVFKDRNDLIPPGDLHPNDLGKEVLRQQWANVMAGIP